MKKSWSLIVLIICLILVICACASREMEEHKTEAEKKLKITEETGDIDGKRMRKSIRAGWMPLSLLHTGMFPV